MGRELYNNQTTISALTNKYRETVDLFFSGIIPIGGYGIVEVLAPIGYKALVKSMVFDLNKPTTYWIATSGIHRLRCLINDQTRGVHTAELAYNKKIQYTYNEYFPFESVGIVVSPAGLTQFLQNKIEFAYDENSALSFRWENYTDVDFDMSDVTNAKKISLSVEYERIK